MTSEQLSSAFTRALVDAEHYHHEQLRKGTTIPYFSHLLAVCSLVLEAGGTETEAIAALFHDAPEDCGGEPVLKAIETNFGAEVAQIVEACSDAMPGKGEKKAFYIERKTAYIEHLRSAGASTMLVSVADKLHNLRAIHSDYLRIGEEIWERFSAPIPKREKVLWYYRSLHTVYGADTSPLDSRRDGMVRAIGALLDEFAQHE